ncbi:MAG: putative molybdenum carrier protein [Methylococcaceae bacterium]|nr:putative molybdenum carrier protein [Methylococcaceae bacterium]
MVVWHLAVNFGIKEKKPYVLIDANQLSEDQAAQEIIAFIAEFNIEVLNVAEPRASNAVRVCSYTKAIISKVIKSNQ